VKTYAVLIGLYLGAITACAVLCVLGALVLASDPVVWARSYWQMTISWSLGGMFILRIGRWLNRHTNAPVSPAQLVSAARSITIADRATKRLLRQMACLGFVLVMGFAAASWLAAPRYLQIGGEVFKRDYTGNQRSKLERNVNN